MRDLRTLQLMAEEDSSGDNAVSFAGHAAAPAAGTQSNPSQSFDTGGSDASELRPSLSRRPPVAPRENTTLTPRVKLHFRSEDQKFILSIQKEKTSLKQRFSVYWNSSDRVFLAKEQSKVLSSALRRTSMNFRETPTSLASLL